LVSKTRLLPHARKCGGGGPAARRCAGDTRPQQHDASLTHPPWRHTCRWAVLRELRAAGEVPTGALIRLQQMPPSSRERVLLRGVERLQVVRGGEGSDQAACCRGCEGRKNPHDRLWGEG